MDTSEDRNKRRSSAEAHLYVAVLKIDGKISARELLEASNSARHSQKKLNVFNVNNTIESSIQDQLRKIVSDEEFKQWTWNDHLDFSLSILKELKTDGDWSVKLVADKIEDGLKKVAWIDGYDLHESDSVVKIIEELKKLKDQEV